jgi:hypothetical protein
VADSQIFGSPKGLVDQPYLDDFEGLHHKDLREASNGPTDETSKQFNALCHMALVVTITANKRMYFKGDPARIISTLDLLQPRSNPTPDPLFSSLSLVQAPLPLYKK